MSDILSNKNATKSLKVNELTKEELDDKINNLNIELNKKIIENENYQQELYELRNKLKACLATQKDILQANELLEKDLALQETASKLKIKNLSANFAVDKKQYEDKVLELQTILSQEKKQNEQLREMLNSKEKLFTKLGSDHPDKIEENLILKEKIIQLGHDLEKKAIIETEILARQQKLEVANTSLQKNYNELNDILEVKKADLKSMQDILETTRDELALCRSELESLRAVPASDSMKGNSLFAEVEDNRKKLINDMSTLKKKYLHMRQNYDSKENEIRALKAERAALFQKLDNDTIVSVNQSARLIETYKSRISELEEKLKMQAKKLKLKDKELQPTENSSSYLQIMLTAKKKEIEDLVNKLEQSSTQSILQEEMKYEAEKQLRQWQYKAMSYQAKLLAVQSEIKCDECQKSKLKTDVSIDMQQFDSQSIEKTTQNVPETNHCETTLEKLLQLPRASAKEDKNLMDFSTAGDLDDMAKTLPVLNPLISEISLLTKNQIPDKVSNKENSASFSNINETILKPTLAKSDGGLLCSNRTDKIKKVLRFTTDTVDSQKPKLTKSKVEKKSYPIVFISSSNESKE